jgi:hypothetical protein
MQPRDYRTDAGMNNHRRQRRQPEAAPATMAGEDPRRDQLFLDHHIEELLTAISVLVDPPTALT